MYLRDEGDKNRLWNLNLDDYLRLGEKIAFLVLKIGAGIVFLVLKQDTGRASWFSSG
jgi:hypothetical protein